MAYLYIFGSAVLASLQLLSQWVIAKRRRTGWLVAMTGNVIGVPYEVITRQYGFLVVCVIGFAVSLRAFREWKPKP